MFRKGCLIKIEDIGPLAVCTKTGRRKIEIELDGERMMIEKRLCRVVKERRPRHEKVRIRPHYR